MDTLIKILVATGVFFGIPPTGKFVSVEGSTIARMENGIITILLRYRNLKNQKRQLPYGTAAFYQ